MDTPDTAPQAPPPEQERQRVTNGDFRRAADLLCRRVGARSSVYSNVQRMADGGAFVEVTLFVSDAQADVQRTLRQAEELRASKRRPRRRRRKA